MRIMVPFIKTFSVVILALLLFFNSQGQVQKVQHDSLSPEERKKYEEQAQQLIAYLEFTFNTIGDPEVSVKDKDIIITESYLKIFRDDKVQAEDDLDEHREVVTNKDVQAYLKDISFFFRKVRFKFIIEHIDQEFTEAGTIYFRVTLNRNLQGITIDGDSVNNSSPRYVEMNLDYEKQDLKIVSIYTTKLSESEEVAQWWQQLSPEWKSFFAHTDTVLNDLLPVNDSLMRNLYDTVPGDTQPYYRRIRQLWGITEIDLSGNLEIKSIDPIRKLTGLKSLNISNSLIGDLTPIRNLTKLERVNCSGTPVKDLHSLHYCSNIRELNISNTLIDSLNMIRDFTRLDYLNCDNTMISDLVAVGDLTALKELRCHNTLIYNLAPLENMINLEVLDISNCEVTTLVPIKNLKSIQFLNISYTLITDLDPLSNLQNLQFLYMDYTPVSNLDPLMDISALQRVYCDHSKVSFQTVNKLTQAISGILIIYDSGELTSWWNSLPDPWKRVFRGITSLDSVPTREQLHEITQIHQIIINGDTSIHNLDALQKLNNLNELNCSGTQVVSFDPVSENIHLQVLNASNTGVQDISPLHNLTAIKWLDLSGTKTTDLAALSNLQDLEYLKIEHTGINNILPLARLDKLEVIYADDNSLNQDDVNQFMDLNAHCSVIWQTMRLRTWWDELPDSWKKIFQSIIHPDKIPTTEQLHSLVRIEELTIIENKEIVNTSYLEIFSRLRKLRISNTPVSDLSPLGKLTRLTDLNCSDNPITSIVPLIGLKVLTILDISNTQVADMELLQNLQTIEKLNVSGTPIKNLKFTESMINLHELDFHNTRVGQLKSLEKLPRLEVIKCYNTALTAKQVDKYKKNHPFMEVVYY